MRKTARFFLLLMSAMAGVAAPAQPTGDCPSVAQAEFSKYYQAVTGKAPPPDAVKFAVDPSVSKSGRDAYAIVSEGAGVTITGSNVRSVLYGVYDLLEKRAGCRWFWDGDVVPKRETIDLSGLDVHEEAHFEYRGLRYFAHRGLTRFQAEHWGFEDWKKEIDWMLKRRLNVFMLRIGQDDLFQRTFPDVCAYPDPSKPLPGAGEGYDNRSLFWSLQFRGELRRRVQAYAFERGLMAPEDFGTMTHWYSRTPEDFLEKKNPPFLPQATSGYAEKNGLVWDVRDEKSSHTDTLCLRYFTANAWSRDAVPHDKVLDEFCASRYGALAGRMKAIWKKVLPASMLRDWDANYGRLVTRLPTDKYQLSATNCQQTVETAQTVFGDLADIPWTDGFLHRDTIDIARMVLDRVITLRIHELRRDVAAWRKGEDAYAKSLSERAANLAALCDRMADLLELHTDYSLWESFLRLDAVEKVRNPDFPKTLFDNASCKYCRSHQYELARHWYAPRMKKMASRLADAVASGDRKAVLFDDPETERHALMECPPESLRPVRSRTWERYREVLYAIARCMTAM